MSDQVQIAIFKSDNNDINQIQQNVNKVLRNLSQRIETDKLGDVRFSTLNLSQFLAAHGQGWIAANGQNCQDTAYGALFVQKTVPNIVVAGTNAYIKVN